MDNEHTPAPWRAEKAKFVFNGKEKFSIIADDNGFSRRVICETPFSDKYKDHAANAYLIATAPELLKRCQSFLRILAYYGFEFKGNSKGTKISNEFASELLDLFGMTRVDVADAKGEKI